MAKIEVERRGGVTVLTINRPESHNCIDGEAAVVIAESIEAFRADDEQRVLVVTGAGDRAFCTGADLKAPDSLLRHRWAAVAGPLGFARLEAGKPTIAAVNGYCFAGGMELAAWCDFRIASETAEFGALNRRWGIPFTDGGTQRFSRIMGLGTALYLIETGVRFGARWAFQIRFVQEVVPAGQSLSRALELAERMIEYPQRSLELDRAAMLAGSGMPLSDGSRLELDVLMPAVTDPDLLKRTALFTAGARPEPPRPPE